MRSLSALALMLVVVCGGMLATSADIELPDRATKQPALAEPYPVPSGPRQASAGVEDSCASAMPPSHDGCDGAFLAPLSGMEGSQFFATCGATTEGEAHLECGGQTYNDVWFNYVSPCTGTLTVTTSSCVSDLASVDFPGSKIVVYETGFCPNDPLGCSVGPAPCGSGALVTVPAAAGNFYVIRVGSSAEGDVGFGALALFCAPEVCDDGEDNDNDLIVDCDDPDCNGVPPCTPDVTVSQIGKGSTNDYREYGTETVDGKEIAAFSASSTSCNPGQATAEWIAGSSARHPVIAQHLYRYLPPEVSPGRPYSTFEMIGMSWLKHSFCAVNETTCGICQITNCSTLGLGCADTYTAFRNGSAIYLGPHSAVNPMGTQFNGVGDGTHSHPILAPTGPENIVGRLQGDTDDLDAAMNPGAQYFIEIQYVTHDEPIAARHNNTSWIEVNMPAGPDFTLPEITRVSPLEQESSVLDAWLSIESPQVIREFIEDSDGGRFQILSKVTSLPEGMWHYEYAVNNLNSHRAAKAFIVDAVTPVANMGFHDVDYHSGEGILGTDWNSSHVDEQARWFMPTPVDAIEVANALRWGTTYNFRFDSADAPLLVKAMLNYYRDDQGSPSLAIVGSGTTHVLGPCDVADADSDNICESSDNCRASACEDPADCRNRRQSDVDEDGLGDICDPCPADSGDSCDPNGSAALELDTSGEPQLLTTPDENVSLAVPAGSPAATYSVTQSDAGAVEKGFTLIFGSDQVEDQVVAAYSFRPQGLQFNSPAVLQIRRDVSSLSPKQRDTLMMWGETGEMDAEGNPVLRPLTFACTVEPNTEPCVEPCIATCVGLVTHFSLYGLTAPKDSDADGVFDQHPFEQDNCPDYPNPDQVDCDGDGTGDVCAIASGDSLDVDGNGIPDECEQGGLCNAVCVWDTDTSGDVRVPDLIKLLACWGPLLPGGDLLCPCLDTDGSEDIRVPDLIDLLAQWGVCP